MIVGAGIKACYFIRWLWVCGEIECYNLEVLCLEDKLTCDRCIGLFSTWLHLKLPKRKIYWYIY